MVFNLFNFFGVVGLIFAYKVVFSRDPVYSVLNFVGMIVCFSLNLVVLGADFLAFLFLIVYAGAIIILFMFVLIMLNVRVSKSFYTSLKRKYTLRDFARLFFNFLLAFSVVYFFMLYFTDNLYTGSVGGIAKSNLFSNFCFIYFNTVHPFGYFLYNYPAGEYLKDIYLDFFYELYTEHSALFLSYDFSENYIYWARYMLDSISCISWLLYTHYYIYLFLGGLVLLIVLVGAIVIVNDNKVLKTQRNYKDSSYEKNISLKIRC